MGLVILTNQVGVGPISTVKQRLQSHFRIMEHVTVPFSDHGACYSPIFGSWSIWGSGEFGGASTSDLESPVARPLRGSVGSAARRSEDEQDAAALAAPGQVSHTQSALYGDKVACM